MAHGHCGEPVLACGFADTGKLFLRVIAIDGGVIIEVYHQNTVAHVDQCRQDTNVIFGL